MSCKHKDFCSGCSYWNQDLSLQQELKVSKLLNLAQAQWHVPEHFFPHVEIHSLGPGQLRERLDFTWQDNKLGLLNKEKTKIIDLDVCLQLTPSLQDFLTEFRKLHWPIEKGSIRLRVSPAGLRGMWLDFSNKDVKFLLEEKKTLTSALQLAHVEIGQRHKTLILNKDKFKLKDPVLLPWSTTYSVNQSPVELYSTIGNFTQVGSIAVKKISKVIQNLVTESQAQRILEFGSGIGTLTYSILQPHRKVLACENNELALQSLEKTLSQSAYKDNLIFLKIDLQKKPIPIEFNPDLLLVNPPRFGVGDFFILQNHLPKKIIYMSCFPESFVKDCKILVQSGYFLRQLHLVDQFPQTSHGEFISFWEKSN